MEIEPVREERRGLFCIGGGGGRMSLSRRVILCVCLYEYIYKLIVVLAVTQECWVIV